MTNDPITAEVHPVRVRLRDRKGGDPAEWPEHLRVREVPKAGGGARPRLNTWLSVARWVGCGKGVGWCRQLAATGGNPSKTVATSPDNAREPAATDNNRQVSFRRQADEQQ